MEELEMMIVDEQLDNADEHGQESFTVKDDMVAEWCIKKIAAERAEVARMRMVVDSAISLYKFKLAEFEGKHSTQFLEGVLANYFESVPHKKTKTQETYALPSGVLKMKKGGIEYNRDEEALTAWVKENAPEFLKVKETTDWAGLKAKVTVNGHSVIDDSGEVIPGIVAIQKPDTFTVEI